MWKHVLLEVTERTEGQRRPFFRVSALAAWYDLYWGVYINTEKKAAYLLVVPCLGFVFEWGKK